MSSYAPLMIDGIEVCSFRNGVDLGVGLLFGPNEFQSRRVPEGNESERWEFDPEEDGLYSIHELVSTGKAIRERLEVLGIGINSVAKMFNRLVSEATVRNGEFTEFIRERLGDNEEVGRRYHEEARLLSELTFDSWTTRVRCLYERQEFEGQFSKLIGIWEEADPRYLIMAVLAALHDAKEVRIDVTDIVLGGYMTTEDNPRETALELITDEISTGVPVVVLTEGSSDARILEQALRVLKPHLVGFLRFPDFSFSPESNAVALVKTLKTFASAGIRNRVVAIFDNDTAAEEALLALKNVQLPRNFFVVRLPELSLATSYPTVGPTGAATMDVNGLAGSIELYLGEDVLRDKDGQLYPVKWGGYSNLLQRYQGEVDHKKQVQKAFHAKVKTVLTDGKALSGQDWIGMELILDKVIEIIST